jgi:hypothetical protein
MPTFVQEYTPIAGSSSMFEFVATFAKGRPGIFARRFPCRCIHCRNKDFAKCSMQAVVGVYKFHDVKLLKVFTVTETDEKRRNDKDHRQKKQAEKVLELQSKNLRDSRAGVAIVNDNVMRDDDGGGSGNDPIGGISLDVVCDSDVITSTD